MKAAKLRQLNRRTEVAQVRNDGFVLEMGRSRASSTAHVFSASPTKEEIHHGRRLRPVLRFRLLRCLLLKPMQD